MSIPISRFIPPPTPAPAFPPWCPYIWRNQLLSCLSQKFLLVVVLIYELSPISLHIWKKRLTLCFCDAVVTRSKVHVWASLVVQWLRIRLPIQGTYGFEPWSGKIPHAAEQLGPWATTTEPARLEPVLRNKRGRDSERPAHRDEEWPPLAATRESPCTEMKSQHSQNK